MTLSINEAIDSEQLRTKVLFLSDILVAYSSMRSYCSICCATSDFHFRRSEKKA